MNNKTKQQVIEKLTLYRGVLENAYQKERDYRNVFYQIERYNRGIKDSEISLKSSLNDEVKAKNLISKDIKKYRRNTLIYYVLYCVFSALILFLLSDLFSGFLSEIISWGTRYSDWIFHLVYDLQKINGVDTYVSKINIWDISMFFSTVILFSLFAIVSILINPKVRFQKTMDESIIYATPPEKTRLGNILFGLYLAISILLHFSYLPEINIEIVLMLILEHLISPTILIVFFSILAILLILTSSNMRFKTYKKDYEAIGNQIREKEVSISNAKEQIELLKPQLQKTYDEYQNVINKDLHIEAINFFPNAGVWETEDYQQSALRLKNINSVIYFLEKNYVETYSEALRYLEVQHHQEKVKREQENLRYEVELAREEAKEGRREASEAKYQADKARLEADNARFRAQQAKAQADQARFQADQARYRSW